MCNTPCKKLIIMKKFVLSIICAMLSFSAFSQDWNLISDFYGDYYIQGFTYENGTAYSVGLKMFQDGCAIFRSDDNGTSWKKQCELQDCSSNNILLTNGRIIISTYAMGSYILCYSDDNGQSWEQACGIGSDGLVASMCKMNDKLFALVSVSGNFVLYKSEDNGTNWYKSFDFPAECYVVNTITTNGKSLVVSAYMMDGIALLYSEDYGQTWSLASMDSETLQFAVLGGNANGFYLAGKNTKNVNNFYYSKDNGHSFCKMMSFPEEIAMVHYIATIGNRLFLLASTPMQDKPIIFYTNI